MPRIFLVLIILVGGCKSTPSPEPAPLVNVRAPGVNVRVGGGSIVDVNHGRVRVD